MSIANRRQAQFFTALRGAEWTSDSLAAHLQAQGDRSVDASLVRRWRTGDRAASAEELLLAVDHIGEPAIDYLARLQGLRVVAVPDADEPSADLNKTFLAIARLAPAVLEPLQRGGKLSAHDRAGLAATLDELGTLIASAKAALGSAS